MTTEVLGTATTSASAPWIPDDSGFGARLALVRQRMGWGNVKEAAEACGIPVQSWRTWERDNVSPRDLSEKAKKISERTGCNYVWLALGKGFGQTPYSARTAERPRDTRPANRRNGPSGGPGRSISTEDTRRPVRRTSCATLAPSQRAA